MNHCHQANLDEHQGQIIQNEIVHKSMKPLFSYTSYLQRPPVIMEFGKNSRLVNSVPKTNDMLRFLRLANIAKGLIT